MVYIMNLEKNEKKIGKFFFRFFFEKKIWFFFEKKMFSHFFFIFFEIHKIYHLGLLCTNFQCSGIIFFFLQIWPNLGSKPLCYTYHFTNILDSGNSCWKCWLKHSLDLSSLNVNIGLPWQCVVPRMVTKSAICTPQHNKWGKWPVLQFSLGSWI